MSINIFGIIDGMHVHDILHETNYIAVSPHFISADKVKEGAKITMGVDEASLYDIMNDKVIPLLILVDKKEFAKRKSSKT